MKFIYEMVVDTWRDGNFFGKFLSIVLSIFIAVFLFLIGWLVFIAVDSWYLEDKPGIAVVVDKEHHSAYTTLISTGKTVVPVYHPERWTIILKKDNLTDGFDVSESDYNSTNVKDSYDITYRIGRLSSELYVESVNLK